MTQSVLKPIPEIIYKSFSGEYLDETAELVTHMFLNHEPMTIVQKIPRATYFDFVKVLLARTLEDGLTKIAVNREDNRVLGAMINEDLNDPPPEIFNDLDPTFHPIFDLLEQAWPWFCHVLLYSNALFATVSNIFPDSKLHF